jgi:hypothetical protein
VCVDTSTDLSTERFRKLVKLVFSQTVNPRCNGPGYNGQNCNRPPSSLISFIVLYIRNELKW